MMNNEVFLAIFIDKYDVMKNFYVLNKFSSVRELDKFTNQFADSEDLRKYYESDISEYFMDNQEIINKNETKNKKFRGRISAFYYDYKKRMEFLEIKYQTNNVVRDFRDFPTSKEAYNFLSNVYKVSFEKLSKTSLTIKEKLICFVNILNKYNYHVSDEEKHYILEYLYKNTDITYKNVIVLLRTNIKRNFLEKASKKDKKTSLKNNPKYHVDENASNFLKYNFDNDEDLFLYHDIDEIDKYTDKFRRK